MHYERDRLGRITTLEETVLGEARTNTYQDDLVGRLKKVIKIVNAVTAEILPLGGVRFPWYNNPIRTLDQFIRGGWKDDAFIDYWKWPRPTK